MHQIFRISPLMRGGPLWVLSGGRGRGVEEKQEGLIENYEASEPQVLFDGSSGDGRFISWSGQNRGFGEGRRGGGMEGPSRGWGVVCSRQRDPLPLSSSQTCGSRILPTRVRTLGIVPRRSQRQGRDRPGNASQALQNCPSAPQSQLPYCRCQ